MASNPEADVLIRNYSHLPRVTARLFLKERWIATAAVDIDDLIAEGNIGLVRAARDYDASFGTKFSTYAIARIRGRMLQVMRDSDPVPRRMREMERAGLLTILPTISLDIPIRESGDRSAKLIEILVDKTPGPEQCALDAFVRHNVQSAINQLPAREALVIRLYYEEGLTLAAIGARLKFSESGAYKVRKRALRRLKLSIDPDCSDYQFSGGPQPEAV